MSLPIITAYHFGIEKRDCQVESSSLSKADRFHLLTERFHLIFRQLVQQLFQTKPGAAYHIMGQQDNLIAPKRGRYAVFYQLLRIRVDDRVLQTGIPVIIYVVSAD